MRNVKIGWGMREISVSDPVSLPGQVYMRISRGIHDPTYATALCIDGGEGQDTVVFCACDREGFYEGIVEKVEAAVRTARPEIPDGCIILNCTHTHAGAEIRDTEPTTPDGQPIYPGSKYRAFFIQMCTEAICEAWDTRAEGGIAYGYGYAVVGHSRRVVYTEDAFEMKPGSVAPNGYCTMYGNTNDQTFSHYEAGADHFLNLMYTFDAGSKLTGILINTPCPSQLSEHFCQMSSDFWHEVREAVKKEYGENVRILPQAAAAGDLSPRILHYKEAQVRRMTLKYGLSYDPKRTGEHGQDEYNKVMAERYDIAERIMNSVREVYGWAKKDIRRELPVHNACKTVSLARRMVSEEEKDWCQSTLDFYEQNPLDPDQMTPEEYRKMVSSRGFIGARNRLALKRWEDQKTQPTLDYRIHVVQIGDIAFASNPFELFQDFMHRLQARSPFIQTFVVQMAGGDNAGYLATERGAHNRGYSASVFCNKVSAPGGQQLVEQTLETLKELKNRD